MKYLLIVLAMFVIGCQGDAQETRATTNSEFHVQLLFEHDGCKVYRFYDGRFIYYTDCRGKTEWSTTHTNGKGGSHTIHHQVPNN